MFNHQFKKKIVIRIYNNKVSKANIKHCSTQKFNISLVKKVQGNLMKFKIPANNSYYLLIINHNNVNKHTYNITGIYFKQSSMFKLASEYCIFFEINTPSNDCISKNYSLSQQKKE